jgi:zinc protease
MRAFSNNINDQLETQPAGVLQRDLGRLLRSGDRRWGLPSRQEMAEVKLEDVTGVLAAPMAGEAIEVVVAGDVSVEEAIRQTAATFGALPRRREPAHPAEAVRVRFPAGVAQPVRLSHRGRADQAIGYIAWPTRDFVSDPQEARAVRVLEQVMRLRLLDELREGQAVTYSPFTGYEAAWIYPGYGYVSAAIEAPPEKLDGFFADALKIARALRETPVSADELQRAVTPRVEAIQRSQASNEYWLGQLAGGQTDPRRLDAIRQSISGLRRVTPADVQRVAAKYLLEPKAYRLVVAPEAAAAAK